MFLQALQGKEKAWGAKHTSTLNTVNNLGNMYKNQGEMAEAEAMYLFTSLPRAQDTGGENPRIDTKDVLKLLIVGDSAVRLLVTLGARSAW
jgi:hypothetical protein